MYEVLALSLPIAASVFQFRSCFLSSLLMSRRVCVHLWQRSLALVSTLMKPSMFGVYHGPILSRSFIRDGWLFSWTWHICEVRACTCVCAPARVCMYVYACVWDKYQDTPWIPYCCCPVYIAIPLPGSTGHRIAHGLWLSGHRCVRFMGHFLSSTFWPWGAWEPSAHAHLHPRAWGLTAGSSGICETHIAAGFYIWSRAGMLKLCPFMSPFTTKNLSRHRGVSVYISTWMNCLLAINHTSKPPTFCIY